MKVRVIVVLAVILCAMCASGASGDRPKSLYKVTRLSTTEVGISCLNGADPTGKKFGDVVIMSCVAQ